jgi:2-polyprenyl-3-methyl-5-hydroxy-6-metoxy-1,4-benzoquinol methylase
MINQYDLIAEEYAKSLTITKKYIILPTFEKIIGKVKDKKVLDLACGSGFFTREIAKRNPSKIIGVDLSSKEIIIAKEQEKKESLELNYICDNVLDLKLKDNINTISAVYLLNYAKSEKN